MISPRSAASERTPGKQTCERTLCAAPSFAKVRDNPTGPGADSEKSTQERLKMGFTAIGLRRSLAFYE